MADHDIHIEFEDEDDIIARIGFAADNQSRRARNLLDSIGDFGIHLLQANVPRDSGYTARHIDQGPTSYSPGGAGGGGSYSKVLGIKAGESKHPLYAEFGTGIYGAVGWYITPKAQPYMTFYGDKAGKVLHKRAVRGQRAQHYFYMSWRELQIFAQGRIMASGIGL